MLLIYFNRVPGKYWKSVQYTAEGFISLLAKQMQNSEI